MNSYSKVCKGFEELKAELLRFRGRLLFARTHAPPILKKGETDSQTLSHFVQPADLKAITKPSASSGLIPDVTDTRKLRNKQ